MLLRLRVDDERSILLALALVLLPVCNLALSGAVHSDETLATTLLRVAGIRAAVVGTLRGVKRVAENVFYGLRIGCLS